MCNNCSFYNIDCYTCLFSAEAEGSARHLLLNTIAAITVTDSASINRNSATPLALKAMALSVFEHLAPMLPSEQGDGYVVDRLTALSVVPITLVALIIIL